MSQLPNYEVIVDEQAFDKIEGIPDPLIDALEQHIIDVSSSPAEFLRPAPAPPYAWGGPISFFHQEWKNDTDIYYFTLFWLYGPEEQQLSLWDVTVSPRFA